MTLVMFDIDGTLTQTYEMDTDWYVRALYEVFGFTEVETDWSRYKHATDAGILDELCRQRLGRLPTPEELLIFRSRFVDLLASALAAEKKKYGQVPGAMEFLTMLMEQGYAVAFATGSWLKSARLKLHSAELHLDHIPAAFADDAHAREKIMQIAEKRAALHCGQTRFETVVYIGDGVWDVRAAKKLRYRFIGIGHGERARLMCDAGARYVFPDYSDPGGVLATVRKLAGN